MLVMEETLAVKAVDAAAVGADPEGALAVEKECPDAVTAKGVGVVGIMTVMRKMPSGLVEEVESIVGADPKLMRLVLKYGPHLARTQAAGVIRMVAVKCDVPGSGVALEKAVIRADPEYTFVVRLQGEYPGSDAVGPKRDMGEMVRFRVKPIESAFSTDPELPMLILVDDPYLIIAEAAWGGGVMAVVVKGGSLRIQPVDSPAEGTDPERPVPVLMQCPYFIVRKGGRIGKLVLKNRESVSVIPVQPVLRPDPHEAVPVLNDVMNRSLRKPVLEREMPKAQIRRLGRETGVAHQYRHTGDPPAPLPDTETIQVMAPR